MCDYSLHNVASRPAKVGDKLVTTGFHGTSTQGFAAVGASNVAVCLLPGTEVAFDREVRHGNLLVVEEYRSEDGSLPSARQEHTSVFHDALEFADGQIVRSHY